jgi:hypothetical protein
LCNLVWNCALLQINNRKGEEKKRTREEKRKRKRRRIPKDLPLPSLHHTHLVAARLHHFLNWTYTLIRSCEQYQQVVVLLVVVVGLLIAAEVIVVGKE